jgi:hypothetical protein
MFISFDEQKWDGGVSHEVIKVKFDILLEKYPLEFLQPNKITHKVRLLALKCP